MDVNKSLRSICITCKKKKVKAKMIKMRSHWMCVSCAATPVDLREGAGLKVLNLYAGIGGNRKLWYGCHVTAVEHNIKIAAVYKRLYPEDTIIVGDAHDYLLKNYTRFDVIWASPPCPSHSRMNYFITNKKMPDMKLYSEITFLMQFFKGVFIIENVIPYYKPLISPAATISRHHFWSNIKLSDFHFPQLPGFIELCSLEDKHKIMDWLDIHFDEHIFLSGKNICQVFKNALHPKIGLHLWEDVLKHLQGGEGF